MKLSKRLLAAATLTVLAGLAAASATLAQDGAAVRITDSLEPKRLEVASGTVVTWTNDDDERHRVRSRVGPVEFDSGNLEPGERFSVTFVVAGEYPYLDERNDDDAAYFGTVVVRAAQLADGSPAAAATVTLIDESFQPPALEVAVGATVTWQNIDGDDDHTVTSTEGAFNSGVLPAGSSFEHTFEAPGKFPYLCAIHPEMQGTVTVVGEPPAASAAPSPLESNAPVESPGAVPSGEAAEAEAVSIVNVAFDPGAVEVVAGTTVTWTNEDGFDHTVTASEGAFNSGVMAGGDAFSQPFDTPGVFDYFCAIHPTMTGTVTVTEDG